MKCRWISGEISYESGQWTLLAIAETVAATIFVVWFSVVTESLFYIAAWSAFGWTLLLRNPVSDRRAYTMFTRFFEWWARQFNRCEGLSTEGQTIWDDALGTVFFSLLGILGIIALLPALYVVIVLIKIAAVLSACFTNPVQTFLSIPDNWRRAALCLDSVRSLELIPGILKHLTSSDPEFREYNKSDPSPDFGDRPTELLDMRIKSWAKGTLFLGLLAFRPCVIAIGLPFALFATPVAKWNWSWLKPLLVNYGRQFGWPDSFFDLLRLGGFGLLGLFFLTIISVGSAFYLVEVQKTLIFFLRGPGRIVFYLPALIYRLALKATTVVYYPLLLYRNRYVGERSVSDTLEDIRKKETVRCVIAYFLVLLFLIRVICYSQINGLLDLSPLSRLIALFIVPASIPGWHFAVAANSLITIVLFHIALSAGRSLNPSPAPSSSQVGKWLLNSTTVVAGLLALYSTFCNAAVIWKHRSQVSQIIQGVRYIRVGPFLP